MRERLPNRRLCETFNFECNGLTYTAGIGRFHDGRLAEIFLGNAKAGSHSDAAAKDSAVVASIAFQHGVPLETIRKALLRDARHRRGAAMKVSARRVTRQLEILALRSMELADRVARGQLDFIEAVDLAY